jgi:CRP-like cAMP-binding protein
MQRQKYFSGDEIIREGEMADSLMFIEEGVVEVYTEFEGNAFVLESLEQGSVINPRAFFVEDLMYVNIRCSFHCTLLVMNSKTLDRIRMNHPEFNTKMMKY